MSILPKDTDFADVASAELTVPQSPPIPETMSQLLRAAVADARALLPSPDFTFDLDSWIRPICGVCYVCVAGAWLVRSNKFDVESLRHPLSLDYDGPVAREAVWAARVINMLRSGSFLEAYVTFDCGPNVDESSLYSVSYLHYKNELLKLGVPLNVKITQPVLGVPRKVWGAYFDTLDTVADLLQARGL